MMKIKRGYQPDGSLLLGPKTAKAFCQVMLWRNLFWRGKGLPALERDMDKCAATAWKEQKLFLPMYLD